MPNIVEKLAFHPPPFDISMGSRVSTFVRYVDLDSTPSCSSSSATAAAHRVSFIHYTPTGPTAPTVDTSFTSTQRPTILFCHGNAEDVPSGDLFFRLLARGTECDVVAWDYLGYGFSSGDKSDAKADCTEKNAFRGVQAVYDHMVTSMRIDPQSIVIMGRSLGSGSAVELAKRLHDRQTKEAKEAKVPPFRGLVLCSALWSAISVVGYKLAFIGSAMDIMKNKNKIDDVKRVPILILHGDCDEVVPYDHGKSLYDKVYPKHNPNVTMWTVAGCGHNDIVYLQATEYFRRVSDLAHGRPQPEAANDQSSAGAQPSASGNVAVGRPRKDVLEGDKDRDRWTQR